MILARITALLALVPLLTSGCGVRALARANDTAVPVAGGALTMAVDAWPSARYVHPGEMVQLTARLNGALDPQYTWYVPAGDVIRSEPGTVLWTVPNASGNVTIQVVGADGTDEIPGAMRFTVRP